MTFRLVWSPTYVMKLRSGVHFRISFAQLEMVESGTTTRHGPGSCIPNFRKASTDTHWIVFPRPISSARMQLLFLHQLRAMKLSPSSW